jgi:hypothetical protein
MRKLRMNRLYKILLITAIVFSGCTCSYYFGRFIIDIFDVVQNPHWLSCYFVGFFSLVAILGILALLFFGIYCLFFGIYCLFDYLCPKVGRKDKKWDGK